MLILSSAVPNKTTAKSRPLCPLHPVTKFTLTRIIIKDIVPTGWTHPHHILCQTFLKSDQYHCKNTISNYLQWAAVQYVRYTCLNLHWLLFWEVHQDGFTNLTFWPNLLACFMYDQKSSRKIHFMALMCTLLGKASHLTAICSWDTSLPVIYHIVMKHGIIDWEYVLQSGWLCTTSWPNNLKCQIEAWKCSHALISSPTW